MKAPRWLSRVLLALAAVLAPWIVLLLASNPASGTAVHVRLAAVGLSAATAGSAWVTAASVWRGSRWMLPASVVCLTLLAFGVATRLVLTHPGGATLIGVTVPVIVAVPGILLAVAVIRRFRSQRSSGASTGAGGIAAGLIALAVALTGDTALAAIYDTSPVPVDHTRSAWVLLDIAELLGLGRTAQAIERGDARDAVLAGTASATLLLTDAWINTVLVPGGHALTSALVYDVIGEIPSALLSGWAALLGFRALGMSEPPGA